MSDLNVGGSKATLCHLVPLHPGVWVNGSCYHTAVGNPARARLASNPRKRSNTTAYTKNYKGLKNIKSVPQVWCSA